MPTPEWWARFWYSPRSCRGALLHSETRRVPTHWAQPWPRVHLGLRLSVPSSLESNGGATFPVASGRGKLVPRLTVNHAARGLYGLCHVPDAAQTDVSKQMFHHS